jgi:hypothetical protein
MSLARLASQELPPKIELVPNQTVEVEGNLSQGQIMPDLSWAWNSSVACFPATEQDHFQGQHVLYIVDIPPYSELTITVIPTDNKADFSLYAYQAGQITGRNLVPQLSSCIRCEADYRWDRPVRGRRQDHTRTVRDILAINRPYQALIAVVGPKGMQEGDFRLQITTNGR